MAPDLSSEVVCFCGHPKNNVVCCGCWFKMWDRRWWLFNNNGNNKKPDAVIHIQDPKPDATAADTVIVDGIDDDSFQSVGLAQMFGSRDREEQDG